MSTKWQTASARNDRERINRARQDAEDLFKPKQLTTRSQMPISALDDASSAEPQPRRQPRTFMIPPVAPIKTAKVEPAAEPKQIPRTTMTGRDNCDVPRAQFGRVRALTSYGMTRAQVAGLYGVTIDEIVRIIGRPDHPSKP